MTPTEIHEILITEANSKSLPEVFTTDVQVHDLTTLRESGTQDFIWILRTCGSQLVTLDSKVGMSIGAARYLETCAKSRDDQMLYYHFRGGQLTPVTLEQAKDIARETVDKP